MIMASDQGGTISMDGGKSWSSWYNQPTGQIYHLSADNRYPYWVYGTQQDSGSVATLSRGDYGEITFMDPQECALITGRKDLNFDRPWRMWKERIGVK